MKRQTKLIDEKTLNLAKFFVTCNVAVRALKNKYIRRLLEIKLTRNSFVKIVLPQMMTTLKNEIELKLISSSSVCLITDIWSSETRY